MQVGSEVEWVKGAGAHLKLTPDSETERLNPAPRGDPPALCLPIQVPASTTSSRAHKRRSPSRPTK
jgi:hypothetical protein